MAVQPTQSMPGTLIQVGAHGDAQRDITRLLPEETPVALVFNGITQAVMMCTPSDLEDFAKGFALTEGFIEKLDQLNQFALVEHPQGIEVQFWLSGGRASALEARRRQMAGPLGCGLCGIESIEEAVRPLPKVSADDLVFAYRDIALAGDALRAHQPLHDKTRAVHVAGFMRPGGEIVLAREDVGRHNALDKLIGAMAQAGLEAAEGALVISSRVSVDMVQKCAMAQCPVLVAISAPTAHAVRLADEAGITIAAFTRPHGFDLYAHPERVQMDVSNAG